MAHRVVIVDDHDMVREGLRSLLAGTEGVEVVGEAATVDDALRVTAETDPDLVLLDLQLGGEDGNEVSRRLRADGSSVKILVLSAQDTSRGLRESLGAGADGYLLKGVSGPALAHGIEQAVSGETVIGQEFLPKLREDIARGVPAEAGAISPAEKAVLELVAEGLSDGAIGEQLGLSPGTVEGHVRSLMDTFHVDGRAALVARAFRQGLLR